MNFNRLEGIDKIYCINLDNRKDRWNNCIKQFNKYNLDVERISAIKHKNPNVGCCLSHLKILKETKYSSILILEDDVEFTNNFIEKYNTLYKKIESKNIDILFLSSWLPKGDYVNDGIIKMYKGYGTHSYVIRKNIYKFIIEKINSLKYENAIDEIYNKYLKYLNTFCFEPGVSYQNESKSDIHQYKNKKFNIL